MEDAIMQTKAYEVARKYITYRYVQSLRRTHNTTDDRILSLIECNNEEVKQENANKNPTVNSVQRDYMAGEVSKDLTMRMLLPAEIVKAHEDGIIHFHDADYYAQHMHNCDLVNLDDMLQNGTVISGTLIEKPHSFSTACNIATQIIAQVASNQYGGQSISLTHLAPFVDISRKKIRRDTEAEMKELGLTDVILDDQCYLYGKLPATEGLEDKPAIGFIAHMDTVSDFCDHDIKPIVTENYDGGELRLGTSDTILSPKNFPHLADLKGRTLITSDGTTVLGADDKAGIAEILTMIERIQEEKIPHGPLCVAFTPDEEIGTGASHFNVEQFGADYGYTLDGDTEGEIQYENFNACKADFVIKGFNVHPGSSKDTMINASLVAMEINNALPSMETPRGTEDYEGFYHLMSMSGEVAEAELHYIVRDHDKDLFEAKKKTLKLIEKDMNEKWGEGTVALTISEQYRNMAEIIATCMHLIDNAKKACENADVAPLVLPIRGGTDGCQLSFKGLPCPNLGTGGHAYHGPYEHITVEGMDKSVDVVTELVKLYAM